MSAPVVITRKTLASGVALRWQTQCSCGGYGQNKQDILGSLQALGPDPCPDAVDAVIGNTSWTKVPACNGCNAGGHRAVVSVGEVDDYDSATAVLCLECAESAVSALRAVGEAS